MQRSTRWLIWSVGGIAAGGLLLVLISILISTTPWGRSTIERTVAQLTDGQVLITGLDTEFPDQLSIQHLELYDAQGSWLTLDELQLDWQPSRLWAREVAVSALQCKAVILQRLPLSDNQSSSSTNFSLPLNVRLDQLAIGQLQLPATLAGAITDYQLNGRFNFDASRETQLELALRSWDGQGDYRLQATLSQTDLQAQLALTETSAGLLTTLSGLQNQPAIHLQAQFNGPLAAVHSHLDLSLTALHAVLDGDINIPATSADLKLTAAGTPLHIGTDLAWQALALDLQIHGQWPGLAVNGSLALDKLQLNQAELAHLELGVQGTAGQLALAAKLAGLSLNPPTTADLLRGVPLHLQADVDLTQAAYPSQFAIQHPLLTASGQAGFVPGAVQAEVALVLPELQGIADLAGIALPGQATLQLNYAQHQAEQQVDISGLLNIKAGSRWANLLGQSARFGLSLQDQDQHLTVSDLHVDAGNVQLTADGKMTAAQTDAHWQLTLNDLSALLPTLTGHLSSQGRLNGSLDDLNLLADLQGELAADRFPATPLSAKLDLAHLPDAASGKLTISGSLGHAPLAVQLAVSSPARKLINIGIEKLDWQSLHAQGQLQYQPGLALPLGKVELRVTRLADFSPWLNQPLSGSLNANLESAVAGNYAQAKLKLETSNIGLADGTALAEAKLALNISDPGGVARYSGVLDYQHLSSGALSSSGQLKLDGPVAALNLHLAAELAGLSANKLQLGSVAQLNGVNQTLLVDSLQVHSQHQTLALLAPVKIQFNDGLSLDKLRLGWQQAELDVAGRISPELALHAELHKFPVAQLSLFMPDLGLSGMVQADANLHGRSSRPEGEVHINADQLHTSQSAGSALPPATLHSTAQLHGDSADLAIELKAGDKVNVALNGQAPLNRIGIIALQAQAGVDLKQLDGWLGADGRQARGRLHLDTRLSGNWSEPQLNGSVILEQGAWQDFASGVAISNINASLTVADGSSGVVKLSAKAGPGTLSAAGNIGLTGNMPVDITLTARQARLLSSDLLTASVEADLQLGGFVRTDMTVDGRIHINRADIRIPERLPAGIAVLKFGSAHAAVDQPAAAQSQVMLNLTLDAPSQIFVRGRGVDAELGGTLHIVGSADAPKPQGEFKLRSGKFTLAGQNLLINQGAISFDNNSLSNPSLNLVANTTRNNVAAVLSVTGNVKNPSIELSSTPKLPQDEVLANLLFGKGSASLSPLEMVQIASTLATLTGVTSGVGDPLDSVRKRLGLDRLSAGGTSTPSLEAGRYIAPGVYLGAKQGIAGGTPQPIIQIDLNKNLKLEGGVGSGAAASSGTGSAVTNSVGVIYQIEY